MAIQLIPIAITNRFLDLVELQLSFPQPTQSSVGVLAELRCAEGIVTDEDQGFVYTIALRTGLLRLNLEECRVRPGARPDDLVAVRSRPEKIKVVDKRNIKLGAAANVGGAASLANPRLDARAAASVRSGYRRVHSWQRSYDATVDRRSVVALPANRWRILPDQTQLLDGSYLVDAILCELEFDKPEAGVEASFFAFPRDLVLRSIQHGLRLHVLKYFSYNKMRMAAVLVAKGLAEQVCTSDALNRASEIVFCKSAYVTKIAAENAAKTPKPELLLKPDGQRIAALLGHRTSRFAELVRIAKLDPKTDLRFCDLSGVDFGNSNLEEVDLTGADLRCADFRRAKVEGAIFTDADLDGARWPTRKKKGSRRVVQSWMKGAPDVLALSHEHYLLEIRRFPQLEPEQEYMLAKRFKEHRDREAASKHYHSHLQNVVTVSLRWWLEGLSVAEVLAAGNAGLADAINIFEADRGIRLATTAAPFIRRSVVIHILDHFPLVAEAIGEEARAALRRRLLAARRRSELCIKT